jgi:hypothetical protein
VFLYNTFDLFSSATTDENSESFIPNSFIFIENDSYLNFIGDYDDNLTCLGDESLLTESVLFLISYLVFGDISSKVMFD